MPQDPAPEAVFNDSFSPQHQRGILRSVTASYNAAYRSVRARFDRHAAHDLMGHERRAYVESNLHALAKRYQLPNPEPKLNHALNSFHTELVSGKCVLTASAVATHNEMVREAIFRETLARGPQYRLFEKEAPVAPDAPLYGIILYGPPPKGQDQRFPGFVVVGFPDPTCERYEASVDLMAKFRVEYNRLVLLLRRNEGAA